MSLNRKISSVWLHFSVIDDSTFTKCDICKQKCTFKTSVTNLKMHLLKAQWIQMIANQVNILNF
jgi:hypothetical protein